MKAFVSVSSISWQAKNEEKMVEGVVEQFVLFVA
jgi:hypothetical protein